jgi:HK97 gp10 family phage protein
MPATYNLKWRGEAISAKAIAASVAAVNETMARCVTMAKDLSPYATGALQGSIRMEGASAGGGGVEGVWGSFDINYAIYQELGTYKMAAHPYLRPAADFEYGLLEARIRRHMG